LLGARQQTLQGDSGLRSGCIVQRVGVRVQDPDAPLIEVILDQLYRPGPESARGVDSDAMNASDHLDLRWAIKTPARQLFIKTDMHRSIRNSAESISSFRQARAQAGQIRPLRPCFAPLGEAERPSGSVIKGLIERRHKGNNSVANALLESVLTLPQGFQQLRRAQTR